MAASLFVETLENHQHSTRLIPEGRSLKKQNPHELRRRGLLLKRLLDDWGRNRPTSDTALWPLLMMMMICFVSTWATRLFAFFLSLDFLLHTFRDSWIYSSCGWHSRGASIDFRGLVFWMLLFILQVDAGILPSHGRLQFNAQLLMFSPYYKPFSHNIKYD
jgi:hypothetical protein